MSRTPLEMWEQVLSPAVQKSLETASQQWEVDCLNQIDLDNEFPIEEAVWRNFDYIMRVHIRKALKDAEDYNEDAADNMLFIMEGWLPQFARVTEYMAVLLAQSEKIIEETNHVL
jgi:hypothetical protein